MQGRVFFLCTVLLLNMIYQPMKFQVDTSNTFWDMLRTKMSDGRTDGWKDRRTETISISPAAFISVIQSNSQTLLKAFEHELSFQAIQAF
jgi:hypothetical protein